MGLFVWFILGITFGYAASIAAGLRNRNTVVWYWCGFTASVSGLAAVMMLPPRSLP